MKQLRAMSGSTGTGATASISKTSTHKVSSPSSSPSPRTFNRVRVLPDGDTTTPTLHLLQRGRPVDLDEIYEHGNTSGSSSDDGDDNSSERSGNAFLFETPETHRMSALTQTLAEKQLGISQVFCALITKISKLVLEVEEPSQQPTCDVPAEPESSHHSEATPDLIPVDSRTSSAGSVTRVSSPPSKATVKSRSAESIKAKRRKCKAMQDQAVLLAHKQARIAQQFEALVFRLEQEAIDHQQANAFLTRQLRLAKVLLRDEAGINLDNHEIAGRADSTDESSKEQEPVSDGSTRPPPQVASSPTNTTLVPNDQSHHDPVTGAPGLLLDSSFAIKEICFSNTVVDVSEMQNLEELKVDEHGITPNQNTFQADENSFGLTLEETNAADNLRLFL